MDNILVLIFGLEVNGVIQLLIHLKVVLKIYFQKFIEKAGMILAHYPENNQLEKWAFKREYKIDQFDQLNITFDTKLDIDRADNQSRYSYLTVDFRVMYSDPNKYRTDLSLNLDKLDDYSNTSNNITYSPLRRPNFDLKEIYYHYFTNPPAGFTREDVMIVGVDVYDANKARNVTFKVKKYTHKRCAFVSLLFQISRIHHLHSFFKTYLMFPAQFMELGYISEFAWGAVWF
jgi:hypothetical protein